MDAEQFAIVDQVLVALEADRLDLPVLPDMALRVRTLLDDPNGSTAQFATLIATDLSISLYLIKAANSAAFSGGKSVSSLGDAIPRLGYKMVYSMVMDIVLTKLFRARSPHINQKLTELWAHSRTVAASCYVLAQQSRHIKPEDAMLAGLVREIGALPLYLYADRHHPGISPETLEGLIRKFSAPIGVKLLDSWNFPDELIDVIAGNENQRNMARFGVADYVDIVTMADLLAQSMAKPISWINVMAAETLGYYPGDCRNFIAGHAEQFAAVNDMLGIGRAQAA